MIHLVHQEDEAFSRESTCCLRGLMAMGIFLSHILPVCNLKYGKPAIALLSSNAYLLVGVFFFLSGYGLYTSYSTKARYIESFLRKRFIPMYVKNCLLIVVYALLNIAMKIRGGGIIILSSFFLMETSVTYGWFIQVTLAFYLAFWLVFRQRRLQDLSKIILMVIFCLIYALVCALLGISDVWYRCMLSFPCGCMFARYKSRLFNMCRRNSLFLGSFLSCVFAFVCGRIAISFLREYRVLLMGFTSLLFSCMLGVLLMKLELCSGFLKTLGKFSFEIYVLQGVGIKLAGCWFEGLLNLIAAILITGILSVLFHVLFEGIDRLLNTCSAARCSS